MPERLVLMAKDSILDIIKILDEYDKDLSTEVTKESQIIAKEGVNAIKNASPKLTGSYRKGWRIRKEGRDGYRIYNATDYQLTHLLERPHLDRTGTRTIVPKTVGHIEKVEKQLNQKFENNVIHIVERGS